jgi:hypothetical protein
MATSQFDSNKGARTYSESVVGHQPAGAPRQSQAATHGNRERLRPRPFRRSPLVDKNTDELPCHRSRCNGFHSCARGKSDTQEDNC